MTETATETDPTKWADPKWLRTIEFPDVPDEQPGPPVHVCSRPVLINGHRLASTDLHISREHRIEVHAGPLEPTLVSFVVHSEHLTIPDYSDPDAVYEPDDPRRPRIARWEPLIPHAKDAEHRWEIVEPAPGLQPGTPKDAASWVRVWIMVREVLFSSRPTLPDNWVLRHSDDAGEDFVADRYGEGGTVDATAFGSTLAEVCQRARDADKANGG